MRRRLISVLALLALFAAPIALLVAASATNCCGSQDCCATGLCPLRAHRAAPRVVQDEGAEPQCHRTTSEQAAPKSADPKCLLTGGCAPERGTSTVLASEAPAVVTEVARMTRPQLLRAIRSENFFSPASGFIPAPFQPPRNFLIPL